MNYDLCESAVESRALVILINQSSVRDVREVHMNDKSTKSFENS